MDVRGPAERAGAASDTLSRSWEPGIRCSRAYDVLHANLFFAMRNQDLRVVTLVRTEPGGGEDLGGRGLATLGRRRAKQPFLIIDGDMPGQEPSPSRQTGSAPGTGRRLLAGNGSMLRPRPRPRFRSGRNPRCCRRDLLG